MPIYSIIKNTSHTLSHAEKTEHTKWLNKPKVLKALDGCRRAPWSPIGVLSTRVRS